MRSRSRQGTLEIVLPVLGGINQPHKKSEYSVDRFDRNIDTADGCQWKPVAAVLTISFFVILIQRYREGRRVGKQPIKEVDGKITRQPAITEQTTAQDVLLVLGRVSKVSTPQRDSTDQP